VDGTAEDITVLDINTKISGMLNINVADTQEVLDFSGDESEGSEIHDLVNGPSQQSSAGPAKQ
jgi:hypothetical protein